MSIGQIFKGIDKIGEIADDNILSQQEKEDILTRRLEIDANSDNQLAKMIRPLITLVTCMVWVFIHSVAVFREVSPEVMYSADAAFMICIGFYFDARRREKISQRKAIAAIKIEKEIVQQQKIQSRREARLERIRLRKKEKIINSI